MSIAGIATSVAISAWQASMANWQQKPGRSSPVAAARSFLVGDQVPASQARAMRRCTQVEGRWTSGESRTASIHIFKDGPAVTRLTTVRCSTCTFPWEDSRTEFVSRTTGRIAGTGTFESRLLAGSYLFGVGMEFSPTPNFHLGEFAATCTGSAPPYMITLSGHGELEFSSSTMARWTSCCFRKPVRAPRRLLAGFARLLAAVC